MRSRDRLLGTAKGYAVLRRLVRADRAFEVIVREHLRLAPGQRLLDLGCGDGALSRHVGDVSYTGIDHNPAYIETALREHGGADRAFVCSDLEELGATASGSFDVVSLVGVLHHLDDDAVGTVLSTALRLLAPGGRIVSVDPVFHPEQRAVARVLMALDRGRYVRHPEHYLALAAGTGAHVGHAIRFDLNPFPYTHLIMEASPAPTGAAPWPLS